MHETNWETLNEHQVEQLREFAAHPGYKLLLAFSEYYSKDFFDNVGTVPDGIRSLIEREQTIGGHKHIKAFLSSFTLEVKDYVKRIDSEKS